MLRQRLVGCALSLSLGLLCFAPHQRTSAEDKPALEPGFKSIFNGKDLTGWHKNPDKIGHGTGGRWVIEDGAITGEQDPPGSGNGGIILSDATYKDFEVIFELNPDWGPCSGFFLRSTEKGNCYQIMLDYHEDGNVGEIYREGLDGASNRTFSFKGDYGDDKKEQLKAIRVVPAQPKQPDAPALELPNWAKIWKIDGWNTIKARVVGNPPTITSWINGHKITTYTSDKAFEGVMKDRGHIAFQVHGGTYAWPVGKKVRFRNVRVKELTEADLKAESK